MSAGSIPYHLRTNKAVDRLLFLELCEKLNPALNIDSCYNYIGFGGPQMEDFRLLHEKFPNLPMLCIEQSEAVMARQKFNCPHTQVQFPIEAQTSEAWLKEWTPNAPVLLWFDYAQKSERKSQFNEFQTLLSIAPSGSIIRITLNADLPLGKDRSETEKLHSLRNQFAKLLPPTISADDMVPGQFPTVIAQMVQVAAECVLHAADERMFHPLLITTYSDSNQMITITGVLDQKEKCATLIKSTSISQWPYYAKSWTDIRTINMPELTLKERIHVNQLLPKSAKDAQDIQCKLGFQIDEKTHISLSKIKNYTEFYRHFPHFGRVAV